MSLSCYFRDYLGEHAWYGQYKRLSSLGRTLTPPREGWGKSNKTSNLGRQTRREMGTDEEEKRVRMKEATNVVGGVTAERSSLSAKNAIPLSVHVNPRLLFFCPNNPLPKTYLNVGHHSAIIWRYIYPLFYFRLVVIIRTLFTYIFVWIVSLHFS